MININFFELPDINFVDVDVDRSKDELTKSLGKSLGKDIYPGSPERILGLTLLANIIQQEMLTNDVGKQNLLQFAEGDYLDALGAFWDEYRKEKQRAKCTVRFNMSTKLEYTNIIPAGTRVKTIDGRVFSTLEHSEIAPGEIYRDIVVEAEESGVIGNGVVPGQINTLIDIFPYYQDLENITTSSGGMEEEDDEHFRERIHESPEKLSTAGSSGAYAFWAKDIDNNIGDVEVYSPSPGEVNIIPLYSNGEIPGEEVLDKIKNDGIIKKRRPLTDKVSVLAPIPTKYNIEIKYWIENTDKVSAEYIKTKVEKSVKDYILWQKAILGRDINPSKLISDVIKAGAKRVDVISPNNKTINRTEVAYADDVKVHYQGLEVE